MSNGLDCVFVGTVLNFDYYHLLLVPADAGVAQPSLIGPITSRWNTLIMGTLVKLLWNYLNVLVCLRNLLFSAFSLQCIYTQVLKAKNYHQYKQRVTISVIVIEFVFNFTNFVFIKNVKRFFTDNDLPITKKKPAKRASGGNIKLKKTIAL